VKIKCGLVACFPPISLRLFSFSPSLCARFRYGGALRVIDPIRKGLRRFFISARLSVSTSSCAAQGSRHTLNRRDKALWSPRSGLSSQARCMLAVQLIHRAADYGAALHSLQKSGRGYSRRGQGPGPWMLRAVPPPSGGSFHLIRRRAPHPQPHPP